MKVWLGPTGKVSQGHVLDCAMGPLKEKLRDLDEQLYIKWNPKKLKGWGLWEVRRRPNYKMVKETVEFGGNTYHQIDYIENNFEHHILDVPFLNYDIITKLKQIDTWANSDKGRNFNDQMDSKAASFEEAGKAKALAERQYELKQQKSMVRDLMDYTLGGGDPSLIAHHWT